jgi:hypothetical protein
MLIDETLCYGFCFTVSTGQHGLYMRCTARGRIFRGLIPPHFHEKPQPVPIASYRDAEQYPEEERI